MDIVNVLELLSSERVYWRGRRAGVWVRGKKKISKGNGRCRKNRVRVCDL